MECPRCGYALVSSDQACPRCASFAQAAPPIQGPVARPGAPAYKRCPVCHQPAVHSMTVCGRCGHSYAPPQAPAPTPIDNYSDRRPIGLLAAAVLTVMLLLFVGGYALHASRRGAAGRMGARAGGANLLSAPAISAEQFDQRLTDARAITGGDLEISLAWNTLTDLDLSVRDPTGELIDAYHPQSSSGGVQDVDANPTPLTHEGAVLADSGRPPGTGAMLPIPEFMIDLDKRPGIAEEMQKLSRMFGDGRAAPRYTHTPIEHIYYEKAPKGIYFIYARCYSWREPDSSPLPFTIQVRSHGRVVGQVSGTLGPQNFIADGIAPSLVYRFAMP